MAGIVEDPDLDVESTLDELNEEANEILEDQLEGEPEAEGPEEE